MTEYLNKIFFFIADEYFFFISLFFSCFLIWSVFLNKDAKKVAGVFLYASIAGAWSYVFFVINLFNAQSMYFQNFSDHLWFTVNGIKFTISFGVDGISLYFIFMAFFIFPFCFLLEVEGPDYVGQKGILNCMLAIEILLIICFSTLDLFVFFLAFEAILFPMLFIIGCYGSKTKRVSASFYFFLYSFIFSCFSLFLILYLINISGSTNLPYLLTLTEGFSENQQCFAWFLLFLTLAAKIPMFPFHIWLPEAHVEAPTTGSIILASLLLKLGVYGFLRFSLPLFPSGTYYFLPLVNLLAILGIVYSSIAAIYQIDLKKIAAYSSIAHMNIAVLGIFSLTLQGIQGGIFTMFAHGLVSSAIFLIIGIFQDRFNTRNVLYLGGAVQTAPLLATYFFFFFACNISLPGTGNFIGEFLCLVGLMSENILLFFFAFVGSFLGVVYSFRTFTITCFGTYSNFYLKNATVNTYSKDVTRAEFICLNSFAGASLFIGIKPSFILDVTYGPVLKILQKY